jgi:hypothetical protein
MQEVSEIADQTPDSSSLLPKTLALTFPKDSKVPPLRSLAMAVAIEDEKDPLSM